ncbi:hypothetical protein [uncultured Algimonas sp.]|uniref:hypothetical protein n=1 Tax=uncultured Algimonas sp. TaxID=1547920 RepID=UPI00260FAEE8|nr:hypothetical protein [uncultured Algimonas sp.]
MRLLLTSARMPILRVLLVVFIAALFHGQALSAGHVHDGPDHDPAHEVCDVCLVATADDDVVAACTGSGPDVGSFVAVSDRIFRPEVRSGHGTGLPASGQGPPRDPGRCPDDSRAPPR